jgi:hypothetical protein
MDGIECPSSCKWLGGLAALHDEGAVVDIEALERAFEQILKFGTTPSAREQMAASLVVAGAEFGEIEGWAENVALAYAAYGDVDDEGLRLVDRYIKTRGRALSAKEVAALKCLNKARASLYEVDKILLGAGMQVRDLLFDRKFNLLDGAASLTACEGDVYYGWVWNLGSHLVWSDAVVSIPHHLVDDMAMAIKEERQSGTTKLTDHLLAGDSAWLVLTTLREDAADKGDGVADAQEPFDSMDEDDQAAAANLPNAEADQITKQQLSQYYENWMGEPTPLLDGMTPREAAARPESRSTVIELVDDAEQLARLRPGGWTCDFDAMRLELGLPTRQCELVYDANEPPNSQQWLELDEWERVRAIKNFHEREHLEAPDTQVHSFMHDIVENQIAASTPLSTLEAMKRLLHKGCSRHAAIHAIAGVVVVEMWGALRDKRPIEQRTIDSELGRIDPSEW